MSQDQADYTTENAVEIHPPKQINVLRESGLAEYKVWGWVKLSTQFIYHVRKLKGAKLSIWNVIALMIDENGECKLTIKELQELTDYSHTEIINSLREMDEMGYLSIDRSGKKNLYKPEFSARGENNPTGTVKKLDSTPVYQVESTPSLEKPHYSIKELKELSGLSIENSIYANVPVTEETAKKAQLRDVAPKMFEHALGFTKPLPWFTNKEWEEFGQWVCDRYEENKIAFGEYNVWRNTPYTKGGMANTRIRGFVKEFYDSWDMFMMGRTKKTDEKPSMFRTIS